jgi:hypothetical protein
MIMLSDNNFSDIIIQRGIEYYEQDLVGDMANVNGIIYAKVNGYDVHVGMDRYGCSCPCYAFRENCKHLYALLLKIRAYSGLNCFRDKPYYDVLKEMDNLMHRYVSSAEEFRPEIAPKIMEVAKELLYMIEVEEIVIPDDDLLEQIVRYEDIIMEIDKESLFGTIMDYLTEPIEVVVRESMI